MHQVSICPIHSSLIAAIDLEAAAGKHRAGDVIKSLRFFERAINTYEEGLRKFPSSFDLAYNKARVQYEVATHPKMAKQLQQPLLVALTSHEYALKLDEDDADLLFNTAQVLTSISEELANGGSTEEAINLLQSAQNLQARCLSVQEQKYAETMEQEREVREIFGTPPNHDNAAQETQDEHLDAKSANYSEEGPWASILEPVTAETLLETIIACFGTMTTLCTTISTSRYPGWQDLMSNIESQHTQLMGKAEGLSLLLTDTEKLHEIYLTDAILRSAMLDASFTLSDVLPAASYKSRLDDLWDVTRARLNLDASFDALIAHANASITFNSSLSTEHDDSNAGSQAEHRWAALASAIKSLTTASRISSISQGEKARTHLLRGDVSLLQYRLSTGPVIHRQAAANAATLLKNAETFYRNSAHLSGEQEDKDRALFRGAVVRNIVNGGGEPALNAVFASDQETRAAEELQEMVDEGLLQEDTNSLS